MYVYIGVCVLFSFDMSFRRIQRRKAERTKNVIETCTYVWVCSKDNNVNFVENCSTN